MENENFTFVVCTHLGYQVEQQFCNRHDADAHFNRLVSEMSKATGMFVSYYCTSVGGLVNAHYST